MAIGTTFARRAVIAGQAFLAVVGAEARLTLAFPVPIVSAAAGAMMAIGTGSAIGPEKSFEAVGAVLVGVQSGVTGRALGVGTLKVETQLRSILRLSRPQQEDGDVVVAYVKTGPSRYIYYSSERRWEESPG